MNPEAALEIAGSSGVKLPACNGDRFWHSVPEPVPRARYLNRSKEHVFTNEFMPARVSNPLVRDLDGRVYLLRMG